MQTKLNFQTEQFKNPYYVAYSHFLPAYTLFKAKLFEYFNYDITRLFNLDKEDLKSFSSVYDNVSIPRHALDEIKNLNAKKDELYQNFLDAGIGLITYDDFPSNLKQMEDFPISLYYKGNFEGINFNKTLAIVGSRKATEQAKINVSNIVSGFKNTDIVLVSGLAEGIDTACHNSAIENNLKTIGVIGSGLKFKYPSSNKTLYQKMENGSGLIISEFPYDYAPKPMNFPQRNRIITALSYGVIIAEAKMKSGAMISARCALEQGKELMCIPGLITNPNCEGVYHLIKQGANLVTNSEDVLNCLNWEITSKIDNTPKLEGVEKRIYEIISCEEISTEGLKQKLDVGINELMIKLTEMELNGLIVQKNGFYYILGN